MSKDKAINVDVIDVYIENTDSRNKLPSYQSLFASGMDLHASIPNNQLDEYGIPTDRIVLHPKQQKIIDSGIKVGIPEGYEIQVRARSGLAAKYSISLVNGIGTIK